MPSVTIGGALVFYAARGEEGAPILFLHGAGSSHLIWNGQLAALATIARAIAIDLPGHGRSDGPGRSTIRSYADVVISFLDALSIERAIIAGHSMGGAIAQTLALENPDRVSALALVGTGARLRVTPAFLDGSVSEFLQVARQFNAAEFAPNSDARLKELSEQQLLDCNPIVFHGDLVACNSFDMLGRVSEISAPTFVVCGAQDWMTPLKYSQYLAGKIPHARLELIQGAGHLLMIEKPEEFNRALLEWSSLAGERL